MRPLKKSFLYGGKIQNPSNAGIDHFNLIIIVLRKLVEKSF